MMLAEQDETELAARKPHLLRLVPKSAEQPRQVSAPAKLYQALEAACEACALQINEASVTLSATGFEVVRSHGGDVRDEEEAHRKAFALLGTAKGPFALLEIDPDSLFLVVSALLGAEPEEEPAPLGRPLSIAERDFVSILADDLCTLMSAMAVSQAESCERELLHKGPGAAQLEAVTPGVKLTMALHWGPQAGELALTLPLGLVETLFAEPVAPTAAANNASWGLRLKRSVGKAPVRVSAVLPVGTRTLGQIRTLGVGDILDLNPLGEAQRVHLKANGHTLFTAELGKVGKAYSVRIISRNAHPAKPDEK